MAQEVANFQRALLIYRVASRYVLGMEFDTEEALQKYLKEHPDADKSKHTVKKEDTEKKEDDADKGGKEKPAFGYGEGAKELEIAVKPARYAKGMMLVQAPGLAGFKSRGSRLAEALKGKWTHREKGYVMSKAKAEKLKKLYDEGWDADFMSKELIPPKKK